MIRRPPRVTLTDTRVPDRTLVRAAKAGTARVQGAEGKVSYDPDLDKLAVDAGATLLIEPDGVTLGRMTPGDIGGWRTGTLVYAGASLATVSADLARSLGRPIDVAPAIAAQRFTGKIGRAHV